LNLKGRVFLDIDIRRPVFLAFTCSFISLVPKVSPPGNKVARLIGNEVTGIVYAVHSVVYDTSNGEN